MTRIIICILICLSNLCYGQELLSSKKYDDNSTEIYLYLEVDELPQLNYHGYNIIKYIADNFEWKEIYDGWNYFPVFSFIIREDGSLTDIKTEWGACPEIEDEVIRVLKTSPKWKPAKIKEKPVDVIFYLPFPFYLRSPE